MKYLNERWVITDPKQVENYERGIECVAFDMVDTTKVGTPRKVCIKKVNGQPQLVVKVVSNLSNYTRMPLVSVLSSDLMASKEESKTFIDNPDAIIERTLSSGARFTQEDLNGLPKEAHSLIIDSEGVFKVINVNTNAEYQKYGIKSQTERGIARVLIAYCENAEEMKKLSQTDRAINFFKFNIKLVEYNDYLQDNPNYKK